MKFSSKLLLDNENGSAERRIARVARSTSGYEEVIKHLKSVLDGLEKHKDKVWNDFDRLIYAMSTTGEVALILLNRQKELLQCQEE